ncbi:MAG: DMT family transporter [Bacteroidota bacterium]|nr:DMT family transporter [Bacteroidota bacterium]
MKKAFLDLHLAILLAGFTAILGKLIQLNEGILVWYRMMLSAVTLGVILYFSGELIYPGFKNMVKIFAVGGVLAMHWVSFYGSIKYSNVSVSVTCLSAIGFFTSLFEPLIMGRRLDYKEVLLGSLSILGVYLIFNFYPQYKTGIAFGITSALLASFFPIFNKNLLDRYSAKTLTFYEMAGGVVTLTLLVPLYLRFFPAAYYLPTFSDWMWLLILAWVCTVFAFILSLNSLIHISAFTVNLSYNLEPIYSLILAFLIFKEQKFLGPGFYLGLGLILLAITLQMRRVWVQRNSQKNLPPV